MSYTTPAPEQYQPIPQAPEPKKTHKLRNTLIGGAALLALIGGCSVAMNGGGSDTATPPVTTTSAQPKSVETTEPAPKPEPKLSVSQQEAIESAESYIDSGDFSKKSLVDQLKYEEFSTKEAEYAVDHIEVDWQQEADDSAASYMDSGSFSRGTLRDQLLYEGFSEAQVEHAVDSVF